MDSLSLVNYLYFYIFSKLLSEYFVSEQNTLKRLGVNNIPGIEEVNLPPPFFCLHHPRCPFITICTW